MLVAAYHKNDFNKMTLSELIYNKCIYISQFTVKNLYYYPTVK